MFQGTSQSLALLTDLYQLTMAYGYWKNGKADQQSVFHLFYRSNPFRGGYVLAAGLETALDFIQSYRFTEDDIAYLASILGNDDRPIFDKAFLDYLAQLEWNINVDAIAEGTVVFPHEPILRVRGSILQCQLLETALLNIINFQSLIATKASRITRAAGDQPVLEFGLRRAQGMDGALSASRAAYIGGCSATSNVLAGKLYGIPVKGTHAHSWVMSFETELDAFSAYAAAMPNNCVFLVDTYDTLHGVRKAIQVGEHLRSMGHRMVGIRLDSGDLASLSIAARKLLDDAGFQDATIVASNDLDEHAISDLRESGAKIGVWGVGTKLITAYDQPALGGVYKLGAIQNDQGDWRPTIKRSEQFIKTSTPGILQVRRFTSPDGLFLADMIYNELQKPSGLGSVVHGSDANSVVDFGSEVHYEELLQPAIREGRIVRPHPSLVAIRDRALSQLKQVDPNIRRFEKPNVYPVGLERSLFQLKEKMVAESARESES
jgi:nicotinate phosphoribosyltransferase